MGHWSVQTGCRCHAHANSHGYAHSYSDAHLYAYCNPDTYPDANSEAHADFYPIPNTSTRPRHAHCAVIAGINGGEFVICRSISAWAQTGVGCRFFDQDGNFVGSRGTSNIGAGPQAAMFFFAIVLPQNALEALLLAGWSLAAR